MAFKRRPAAFVKNVLLVHQVWFFQVCQHQISKITRPDKTSLFYLEAYSGRVAHFFYNRFKFHPALMVKFQHGLQCMLNQRPPGRRLEISVIFFFNCMWGVVGGYHIKFVIKQSLKKCFFIVG